MHYTKPMGSIAAAAAKSFQSCPTLYDPIDGSPPGSPVPGILQARTLEWVAISFSSAWKWKVKVKSLGRVGLLATPWTEAHQGPLSMGLSRQEYWSGVPLPSPVYTCTHKQTCALWCKMLAQMTCFLFCSVRWERKTSKQTCNQEGEQCKKPLREWSWGASRWKESVRWD